MWNRGVIKERFILKPNNRNLIYITKASDSDDNVARDEARLGVTNRYLPTGQLIRHASWQYPSLSRLSRARLLSIFAKQRAGSRRR